VSKEIQKPIAGERGDPEFQMNEEEYRSLFQFANDIVWIHDLKGRVVVGNRALEQLHGQTMEFMRGRNVREFLSPHSLEIARAVKRKLLGGESVVEKYEEQVLRDDGSQVILQITTCLVLRDGQPVAFHNIARDVTAERRAQENLRFYVRRVLEAHEEERKRISRDLHDATVQPLVLLIHGLDTIASQSAPELSSSSRQKLAELRDLADQTVKSLRVHIQDLRPAILDDIGLVASLEWISGWVKSETNVDVKVFVDNEIPKLPPELELTLFRITQEALSNIRKHAEAQEAQICIGMVGAEVRLTISDDGVGFTVPSCTVELAGVGKLGLTTMRERAELLGGAMVIYSEPGIGTTIDVRIPLRVMK
jgi:PAS domain S-box-containing protein